MQTVPLLLWIMAAKDVSKWIEILKDEEIHWHDEMERIILKKYVCEVKSQDVETRLGPLNGCPDFIWKATTTKFFKMFPAEGIAKKNVFGNGVLLVDPPNTMLFRWIAF